MAKKKSSNLLKGDQLTLVMDEVKQGDRAILTVLCDPSKLNHLLEFAQQNLGDRLVGQMVLVDLTIANATTADADLFRQLKSPAEMVVDWEVLTNA